MSQIPSTESSVVKYIHTLSENVASAEMKMFADLKPYRTVKTTAPCKALQNQLFTQERGPLISLIA